MSSGDLIAWVAFLGVAVVWYFARIGRRVRVAKEAKERAAQDRVGKILTVVQVVTREFGAFMEATTRAYGGDPTAVFDVSLLPYPKDFIKGVLMLAVSGAVTEREAVAQTGGLMFLCQFQPNVGSQPLDAFGGAVRFDALPASREEGLKLAADIAAASDRPEYQRWLELSEVVAAEMATVTDALVAVRGIGQRASPKP